MLGGRDRRVFYGDGQPQIQLLGLKFNSIVKDPGLGLRPEAAQEA